MALALLTIATFAFAASWNDDSHYVSLGSRSGYYIVRRTTSRDVEATFGRPQNIERRSDGIVTYYAIQVYNPFEDLGGRR